MNTDELIAQMQKDELEDQPLIAPVAYGRLRGIAPQQVYYWIRTNKLEVVVCNCGRRCIEKEAADDILRLQGKLPPKDIAGPHGSNSGDDAGGTE